MVTNARAVERRVRVFEPECEHGRVKIVARRSEGLTDLEQRFSSATIQWRQAFLRRS